MKPRLAIDIETWMTWALWSGPTPADTGIGRCDELLARLSGNPLLEGNVRVIRGSLKAMRGRFDDARADVAAGRARLHDIGHRLWWAGTSMVAADAEFAAGDPEAAARLLREGYDVMRPHAETGYLASLVGMRAQAALELGQDDEALRWAAETEELASLDDFEPRVRQGSVRAVVFARRGDFTAAEEALREAERRVEPTDYLPVKALPGDKAGGRGETCRPRGRGARGAGAGNVVRRAKGRPGYSKKGAVPAKRARLTIPGDRAGIDPPFGVSSRTKGPRVRASCSSGGTIWTC